jgi:hypothetical protein
MMTGGEERWVGGCCRRLQELGKNIKNEIEFGVHTGGGGRGLYRRWCPSTGEERRGLYVQEVVYRRWYGA